jgi:hypothetical protein
MRRFAALHAALEQQLQDIGASLGKPDWVYRDLPKMSKAFADKFEKIVGVENIHRITWAEYPSGAVRGQILISPDGMKRLRDHDEGPAA